VLPGLDGPSLSSILKELSARRPSFILSGWPVLRQRLGLRFGQKALIDVLESGIMAE